MNALSNLMSSIIYWNIMMQLQNEDIISTDEIFKCAKETTFSSYFYIFSNRFYRLNNFVTSASKNNSRYLNLYFISCFVAMYILNFSSSFIRFLISGLWLNMHNSNSIFTS